MVPGDPLDSQPGSYHRGPSGHAHVPGIVAAALLGDVEGARREIEASERLCSLPDRWTRDCIPLPGVAMQLEPMLAQLESAARAKAQPLPAPPFTVRRVPRSARIPHEEELDDYGPDKASLPPALAEWDVVRMEREGDRVTALSSRRRYPALDSLAAYRLHLSRDGGASFDEPLCLGFTELEPWMVRARSRLPLREGDLLQVEVLRCPQRELEEAEALGAWMSSTWPCEGEPVAAMLAFSVAGLRLDSDGDGLTDAQEGWWFLDPLRRDTDGDTLSDADRPAAPVPATMDAGLGHAPAAHDIRPARHPALGVRGHRAGCGRRRWRPRARQARLQRRWVASIP